MLNVFFREIINHQEKKNLLVYWSIDSSFLITNINNKTIMLGLVGSTQTGILVIRRDAGQNC